MVAGRRNNARIVATGRKQICHVGLDLQNNLVGRPPGRHVVALGTDRENRDANIGERDWPAVDFESAFGKIVVEE